MKRRSCRGLHPWGTASAEKGIAIGFSRSRFDEKTNRRRPPGSEATAGGFATLARDNPDKALVMSHIGQLVADGLAAWTALENGEIEVRLATGEIYLLGEATILRLA